MYRTPKSRWLVWACVATAFAVGDHARAAGGPETGFPGFYSTPFVPATSGTDNTAAYASAVADFDGDGDPDLVTVQQAGTLNLLSNDGSGAFSVTYSNQSASAYSPSVAYVQVADLNGDGLPDVVAQDVAGSAFLVFLNAGDGTFARATSVGVSPESGAGFNHAGGGLVVGDVNGDGIPDVVTVSPAYAGSLPTVTTTFSEQTFLGKGDGTFETPAATADTQLAGQFVMPWGRSLALADLDHDGTPELVAKYFDYTNHVAFVTVSPRAADGSFEPLESGVEVSQVAVVPGLGLADLNGDGNLDVVFAFGGDNAWVALGNGDATLQTPFVAVDGLSRVQVLQLGDFDADGVEDLLVYGPGATAVYPGLGDGTFDPIALGQYGGDAAGNQEPSPEDFDGDGNLDYVLVDPMYGAASLYRGFGDGDFLAQRAVASSTREGAARNYAVIATGDANGDGKPDLLAVNFANLWLHGGLWTFDVGLNDGHGGFVFSTAVKASDLEATGARTLLSTLTDLNHDGYADLLMTGNDYLGVALGKADGTFEPPSRILLPVATSDCQFDHTVDVADIDHDGNLDLLVPYAGSSPACIGASTRSGYFVLLGDGEGGFTVDFVKYGETVHQTSLVDVDGDGNLDLVVVDGWRGSMMLFSASMPTTISVLPGKGDGTFDAVNARTVLDGWKTAGVVPGDYDGDGTQDLTVLSWAREGSDGPVPHTDGVLLLKGHGDFTFDDPVLVAQDTFATEGRYADLNGDGLPELAFAANLVFQQYNKYAGLIVLPNLGGGSFGEPLNLPSPVGDQATMVSDFNGDGAPDVLVAPDHSFYGKTGQMPSVVFLNRGTAAPDFTMTATPESLDLRGEDPGTVSLDFTANAAFGGNVTVACSGLPAGATCTFSPRSLSLPPGGSGTMKVVLSAGDTTVALAGRPSSKSGALALTFLALLPGIALVWPTRRRKAKAAGASIAMLLMLSVLSAHCGGKPAVEPTPVQVTLTATGTSGTSSVVHTAVVSATFAR